MREETNEQAFPQSVFHHWGQIPGDPFEAHTKAGSIVVEVRKRKGLEEGLPTLDRYIDKL